MIETAKKSVDWLTEQQKSVGWGGGDKTVMEIGLGKSDLSGRMGGRTVATEVGRVVEQR